MSESVTPSGGLIVNPLFTALIPNEGPKGVGLNFDFSVSASWLADFQQAVDGGRISGVQSLFVDNWASGQTVTVISLETGHRIEVPPYSQGLFPILTIRLPKIQISSSGTGLAAIYFLNVPVPYATWSQAGSGGTSVVVTNTVTVTGTVDIGAQPIATFAAAEAPIAPSATAIATGGTAVTVFPVGFNDGVITNPSSETATLYVGVNINAGTVEIGPTFGLAPGQSFTFGHVTGSITANSTLTGHTFSAVANLGI